MSKKVLPEWDLYEAGINYNNRLLIGDKNYYETIDVNIAFANDDQWRNVEAKDISKPMIPVLQKAKQHTVSNLTSTNISATVQPLGYTQDDEADTIASIANAEIRNIFDDIKYEFKVREGLGDAFDMGDMCLHFFWDADVKPFANSEVQGKIDAELVDGPNVMFGNANNPNPKKQPYIIIVGRQPAIELIEEAKLYKNTIEVEADDDFNYQAGDAGKIELDTDKYGKALYIIIYKKDKKTKKVMVSKFIKSDYIYKDIDTGLTEYPVAFMNYKKQKNQYHGRAGATGLISNQIAINKLCAMAIYSVMKTAFPTLAYDADRIAAPSNEIGRAIPIHDLQNGEGVRSVAGYLEVGQMSGQVIQMIELMINYTKDMLGINDAAVGNINPDNTSAMALAEKLSSVPLENVKSNLYEFTEQVVDIILDFISTKYGVRPVKIVTENVAGIQDFDFTNFGNLVLNKKIDVGAIGYASELSSIRELRDLLQLGKIETIDYLERLPEYTIPKVKELVETIKARLGYQDQETQKANEQQWEQMMQFMQTLPADVQEQLKKLPDNQLEQQLTQLMEQAPQQ